MTILLVSILKNCPFSIHLV